MLKCSRCKQELAEESFYVSRTTKRGFTSYCKICAKKYAKDREKQTSYTQVPSFNKAPTNNTGYQLVLSDIPIKWVIKLVSRV